MVRNPIVKELATRYDRTPAQIVLRWHMELGLVTVPKSNDPERIRRNIDIFDFALTADDVAALSAIDDGSQPRRRLRPLRPLSRRTRSAMPCLRNARRSCGTRTPGVASGSGLTPRKRMLMPNPDLHAAADRMTRLLEAVPDDSMEAPTPCPDLPLGALIDHVGGFAKVFAASARKEVGELTAQPPDPRADNLEPGWRARMAADLSALADAWDAPDAWEGMTQAGGQELPGAMAGRIALDELVVHGWDIAQATGQPFDCDAVTLGEVEATVQQVRGGNDGDIPGLFGPVVAVADDADALERVLSLTGRDPGWSPA